MSICVRGGALILDTLDILSQIILCCVKLPSVLYVQHTYNTTASTHKAPLTLAPSFRRHKTKKKKKNLHPDPDSIPLEGTVNPGCK